VATYRRTPWQTSTILAVSALVSTFVMSAFTALAAMRMTVTYKKINEF
jgi:hypothetical protein